MKPITTKWPGVVIVGKPLTPEQVIDVVFNTLPRIWRNEDHLFAQQVKDLAGFNSSCPGTQPRYFSNSIVPSSWPGGNENYVHHDGTIFMWHNIGKWPSDDVVQTDLEKIAKQFPFIDMVVSIMSQEIDFLEVVVGGNKLVSCDSIVLPDPSLFIHQYVVKGGEVTKQEYDPNIVESLLPSVEHFEFLNSRSGGGGSTYFTTPQEKEFLKLYKDFYRKGKK